MARGYFNRYKSFKFDGNIKPVPFIQLDIKPTDEYIITKDNTRFDILSQKYFGTATHGFLILQANPELGSLENDIKPGTRIRIPLPFNDTMVEYNEKVKNHIKYYGL